MSSDFQILKAAVDGRGEAAAVAKTNLALQANGHRKLPKLQAARVHGVGTVRIYTWADTPFGDDIVLITGPNVESELKLGREIAKPSGPGFYVQPTDAEPGRAVASALARTPREVTAAKKQIPEVAAAMAAPPPPPAPPPRPARPAVPAPAPRAAAAPRAPRVRASAPVPVATAAPAPVYEPPPPPPPPARKSGGALAALLAAAESM